MRFLVLGACGMVGHLSSLYLQEKGHHVTGFSRRNASFLSNHVVGDALDDNALRRAIDISTPDIIVNSIALLNADSDSRTGEAVYLNSYLPHHLSDLCKSGSTRIFHISTDGIFAGNSGPYEEHSVPDDLTNYGKTKALGELDDGRNLTFRTSIVGPDINSKGIGLLNWFMAQTGSVEGYTGAIWTGLTSLELAKAIDCCARDGSTGLVSMVPDSSISKYDLLNLFNKYFRGSTICIARNDSLSLDRTLVRTNLKPSFQPGSYDQQIEELSEWVKNHKDLYPHY